MANSFFEPIAVLASAKRTTTSAADSRRLFDFLPDHNVRALEFVLGVTSIAGVAGDKLDVTVQTNPDGTNWVDVVHFTQVIGTGTAPLRYYSKIDTTQATTMFEGGTALTAGNIRNLFGQDWRASWTVSDTSVSTINFTFDVTAVVL